MTTVAPYQDVHAEREPRELVFQRLECLHASCCDLHAQIEEISQGDVPPVVIPPDVVYSWGHETYLPSFEQPLRGIFSQRRRSLCAIDMDEPDLNPDPNSSERTLTLTLALTLSRCEIDMDAAPLDSLAWLHDTWGSVLDVVRLRVRLRLRLGLRLRLTRPGPNCVGGSRRRFRTPSILRLCTSRWGVSDERAAEGRHGCFNMHPLPVAAPRPWQARRPWPLQHTPVRGSYTQQP